MLILFLCVVYAMFFFGLFQSGGLDCCVTWFPDGQVTCYWWLLTGRQEALVCGVSHASHVSLKMQ